MRIEGVGAVYLVANTVQRALGQPWSVLHYVYLGGELEPTGFVLGHVNGVRLQILVQALATVAPPDDPPLDALPFPPAGDQPEPA
jgi:hypothetical protein